MMHKNIAYTTISRDARARISTIFISQDRNASFGIPAAAVKRTDGKLMSSILLRTVGPVWEYY